MDTAKIQISCWQLLAVLNPAQFWQYKTLLLRSSKIVIHHFLKGIYEIIKKIDNADACFIGLYIGIG
jgi:hypothetical protein